MDEWIRVVRPCAKKALERILKLCARKGPPRARVGSIPTSGTKSPTIELWRAPGRLGGAQFQCPTAIHLPRYQYHASDAFPSNASEMPSCVGMGLFITSKRSYSRIN